MNPIQKDFILKGEAFCNSFKGILEAAKAGDTAKVKQLQEKQKQAFHSFMEASDKEIARMNEKLGL